MVDIVISFRLITLDGVQIVDFPNYLTIIVELPDFYKYPHVPLFIRGSRYLLSIWIFFCKSYFSTNYILRVISKIFVSIASRYNSIRRF